MAATTAKNSLELSDELFCLHSMRVLAEQKVTIYIYFETSTRITINKVILLKLIKINCFFIVHMLE